MLITLSLYTAGIIGLYLAGRLAGVAIDQLQYARVHPVQIIAPYVLMLGGFFLIALAFGRIAP